MQCLEASELISLRLDEPLSAEQERVLQAHLADCQTCRKEWQMMQRVTDLFDNVSLALPPPRMAEMVMARICQRDRRLTAWQSGMWLSAGLIIALLLGSVLIVGISSLVVNAMDGPSFVRAFAQAITHLVSIVATVLEASAIVLRALLASPTWLVVVGYLILAGVLLLGWTRVVMRPYRAVAERQGPR